MTTADASQPRRVSVVGNSGSGKSRLARAIAAAIGAPCIELDQIHHLPDWQPIDPDEFISVIEHLTEAERWVVDGNYKQVVVFGPVWQRADTVVWLDLPRRVVMRQVVVRTLRRTVMRERLWNGNREPFSNLYRWDPARSIIRWSWTQHKQYTQRFEAAMVAPELAHLRFVRLTSHDASAAWLRSLQR